MLAPVPPTLRRLRLDISGAVQGVGFRPHVYRLARERELAGWIVNDTAGVRIEVEGDHATLQEFARVLRAEPPARARVLEVRETWLEPNGAGPFRIRPSEGRGAPTVAVLPDLATCPECLADVTEPGGRRHGYAFTNCTHCGPRLSIVRDLPYDRPHTTMSGFTQCPACQAEYEDPGDRRFHAQPNACPACGPRLEWWDATGHPAAPPAAGDEGAIAAAARAIARGEIVAVKGLGGFHLVADATDDGAVRRLRSRKGREAKPLAVMVADVAGALALGHLSPEARRLLTSPEAPIVLLPARSETPLAPSVAPSNPRVGVMLAYTPLHHLLLAAVEGPVVATSGNRSGEPICTDGREAVQRLEGIADHFLVHDRPIQRPVDDSVLALVDGAPQLLRRSRGYAPLPVALPFDAPPLLAVGGHQKSTVAVARGRQVFVSQHIGDLETPEAQAAFRTAVADYQRLYRVEPVAVAHDLHPDYVSTRWVDDVLDPGLPRIAVQHHHAHLASVLAEARVTPDAPPTLGIIWDGTGYGLDGTIWGGEFLLGGYQHVQRVGHLRPFALPGGERAVLEPRRAALGVLLEAGIQGAPGANSLMAAFTTAEKRVMTRAVERGLHSPRTSSAGRFFDAVSALLGLRTRSAFEADAAMQLEFAADPTEAGAYPLDVEPSPDDGFVLDWEPLIRALLADRHRGVSAGRIAARVHNGLVAGMVRTAARVGAETVALSGGCFQNRILLNRAGAALRARGHRVCTNRVVPPGDGGIALGQAAVAAARLAASRTLCDRPSPEGV
jgi:hydrogenase maturation protein HypF